MASLELKGTLCAYFPVVAGWTVPSPDGQQIWLSAVTALALGAARPHLTADGRARGSA